MIEYFSKIREILDVVEKEESDNIKKAVELLTETIFNKGSIYIFGASHAGILCEEMYYRAGGLMLMNPIFAKELMLDASPVTKTSKMEQLNGYGSVIASKVGFKKGDVLIVHSVSGRNPVGIEMAIWAQGVGVKVIVLTNLSYSKSVTSRHDAGKNLYEYSDIIIDNHGDIGDACVKLPGLEQQVGATSTVVGATVLNSIIVETTRTLLERGMKKPPIFYSANLDGGDELNQKLFAEYKDSIHYKL